MSSRSVTRTLAAALAALPLSALAQAKPAQGGGKAEITWYGHAAFVVRTPGWFLFAKRFGDIASHLRRLGAYLKRIASLAQFDVSCGEAVESTQMIGP